MIKLNKLSVTNIILGFFLIFSLVFNFTLYNKQGELKARIDVQGEQIKKQETTNGLNEFSEEFIKALSTGEHSKYLTGDAKEAYEQALSNEGEEHNHMEPETNILENYKIQNLYSYRLGENQGKTYAIFQSDYSMNIDDTSEQGQIFSRMYTAIFDWELQGDEYKVSNFEIQLLEDGLDKYMRELAEKNN